MKSVQVRNMVLNADDIKVCNALMGSTKDAIVKEAKILLALDVDMLEWRADCFREVLNLDKLKGTLTDLRHAAKNRPLVFSIRNQQSGAEKDFTDEERYQVCKLAIESGCIDVIEVEATFSDEYLKELLLCAQEKKIKTIVAFYNYENMPNTDEIVRNVRVCEKYQPDIIKLAIITNTKKDVFELMSAIITLDEAGDETPRVVVAMGDKGIISRIMPSYFDSIWTYASGITTCMPGQVNLSDLKKILLLTK